MKRVFINVFGMAFVIVSFTVSASESASKEGEYKSAAEIPGAYVVAKSNPCNPCNPCAAKKPDNKPIRSKHTNDYSKLLSMGKKLWNNDNLGKSGLSCMSCHDDHENLHPEKGLHWPRYVGMTNDILTLDQMINFCMVNPIEGKPLDPNSMEMTAMAAYYMQYMKSAKNMGTGQPMNPCNPCSTAMPGGDMMQNPCSAAMPGKGQMQNPCSTEMPGKGQMMNPCSAEMPGKGQMMNPCNPCGR